MRGFVGTSGNEQTDGQKLHSSYFFAKIPSSQTAAEVSESHSTWGFLSDMAVSLH